MQFGRMREIMEGERQLVMRSIIVSLTLPTAEHQRVTIPFTNVGGGLLITLRQTLTPVQFKGTLPAGHFVRVH